MGENEPDSKTDLVDLPLCALHVMEAGEGPPLIIVPATISELENWVELVRFMGQWFRTYFFELPGHGQSTPLPAAFTSDLVAGAVGQLADHIGAQRFSLMGFSFGGILAMKTFLLLRQRIDSVIFISPCVTGRALLLTRPQRFAASQLNRLLKIPSIRSFLYKAAQNKTNARRLARLVHVVGKVENYREFESRLAKMRPSMIEIVSRELDEILGAEFPLPESKYETPCHFAMSVNDPVLHYRTTLDALRSQFLNVRVTELSFRFHQPPRAFTLDELNHSFRDTLAESLLRGPRSGDTPGQAQFPKP
ncbi:MAG: alpha/beta hydrolase [Chloroflexota bacterium]